MICHDEHGAGAPVVLLHGVGLDRALWERCVPALARRHRVLVPDLPGHGRSGPVPEGVGLADLAEAVAGWMPGRAHVVGFSLGALVAQELSLARPDLVDTLTLVSSVADRTDEERAAVLGRLETAGRDPSASADAAVRRWFDPEWLAREAGLAERVRATLTAQDPEQYRRCYRVFATADRGLWPRLGGIGAPALAVTGEEDPGSTPRMSRALAEAIPRARAEVLPGARHLLPLQCPDALARLVLEHIGGHEDG